MLVVQADELDRSNIQTAMVAVITSNLPLGQAPGNGMLTREPASLPRNPVVNVSQIITVGKAFLTERVGRVPDALMAAVDAGLKLALDLRFGRGRRGLTTPGRPGT